MFKVLNRDKMSVAANLHSHITRQTFLRLTLPVNLLDNKNHHLPDLPILMNHKLCNIFENAANFQTYQKSQLSHHKSGKNPTGYYEEYLLRVLSNSDKTVELPERDAS